MQLHLFEANFSRLKELLLIQSVHVNFNCFHANEKSLGNFYYKVILEYVTICTLTSSHKRALSRSMPSLKIFNECMSGISILPNISVLDS